MYKEIFKYPVLLEQPDETPILNELRHKTTQKMFALRSIKDNVISRRNCRYADKIIADSSTLYLIDPNTTVKCLTSDFFTNAIALMGTERHRHFIENSLKKSVSRRFRIILRNTVKITRRHTSKIGKQH